MCGAASQVTSRQRLLLLIAGLCCFILSTTTPDSGNCGIVTSNHRSVPDCNCTIETVNEAIRKFISPILVNLTSQSFFRYFNVDLARSCPYWKEDGLCMMEGCSVCTCDEGEVPKAWLKETSSNENDSKKASEYGWIAPLSSNYGYDGRGHDDSLGRITSSVKDEEETIRRQEIVQSAAIVGSVFPNLEPSQTGVYWQRVEGYSSGYSETARYVNLLKNPECFTGYSGPSASRVWRAIQQENCFGDHEQCLEKRIFYRLLSGLQASISTHIARQYLHTDGRWAPNLPLYWSAVGRHPDRLNSMYFTFLFLLRSVVRAKDFLLGYPYVTGVDTDDSNVVELLNKLLLPELMRSTQDTVSPTEECHRAFDESELFQVSELLTGPQYWSSLEEKQALRMEFMAKFHNISSIMDCVSCEKCRLWGKLQILGIGSAIKILLTPAGDLAAFRSTGSMESTCSTSETASRGLLSREEVIALVNTLNQFSNSLLFASEATSDDVL